MGGERRENDKAYRRERERERERERGGGGGGRREGVREMHCSKIRNKGTKC